MMQAGTLLIVARMLGSAHFGAYSGIVALAVLLGTLATFGTHLVLLGETSKEPTQRNVVLPYALPTTLLVGGVLFLMYEVLASYVMNQTGIGEAIILAIGVSELLLQPFIVLASVEHQAHGHIARSQLLTTLPLGLRLLVAFGVWVVHPQEPLAMFALGYLLVTGLAVGIAVWHLPEPWPKMGVWRLASKEELGRASGYAMLNLTAIGPSELDKALAVKLMPLSAVGIYAAGTRIVGALILPVMSLLIAALPRLFRESAGQDTRQGHLIPWIFAVSFGYGLLSGFILWKMSWIFSWMFGNSFQGLLEVLPYLALAVPGFTMRFSAGAVLVAQAQPWFRVWFELFGMVTLVTAAYLLVPSQPTSGMPLALALAEWSMAILGWFQVWRSVKLLQ